MIRDLWTFQNGHCYMCAALFHRDRYVTKEHVVPRALGGTNDANILLACIPCNNTKADRPPTRRELAMLAAWLHNDRNAWYRLMMTLDPDIPPG
jgi:5-methylcytosine-specific restriction endonuclease McrA